MHQHKETRSAASWSNRRTTEREKEKLSRDGGWQVRDVDVEEKGRQDRSLWDAVLEAP